MIYPYTLNGLASIFSAPFLRGIILGMTKQNGRFRRLWEGIRSIWAIILATVVASSIVIFALMSMTADPDLAIATVAVATFLMVWATAFSIESNRRLAKRRRAEELAKEKRDNKESLLNEIIQWAIDIANCRVAGNRKGFPELQYGYETMEIKSEYIIDITKMELFAPSLKKAVKNLTAALGHHIDLIQQFRDIKKGEGKEAKLDAVIDIIRKHNAEITKHFRKVVYIATAAKLANMR